MIEDNVRIMRISAVLSDEEVNLAKAYILGAVHSRCTAGGDPRISIRRLFGGDNANWKGTPLQAIYNYYVSVKGYAHEKAADSAAQDVGKLLKTVLYEDKTRTFRLDQSDSGNNYVLL